MVILVLEGAWCAVASRHWPLTQSQGVSGLIFWGCFFNPMRAEVSSLLGGFFSWFSGFPPSGKT